MSIPPPAVFIFSVQRRWLVDSDGSHLNEPSALTDLCALDHSIPVHPDGSIGKMEGAMGPLGHFSVGLAAKPLAPKVPLGVLLLATWLLDVLAIGFGFAGIERGGSAGLPWSHGLFMSVIWSVLAALLTARIYRTHRAGVVGLLVFSHWVLDFISHPIPFSSFSWRSWQWSYGHPLPSDLPLLFSGSPKVGLGLYNSISAVEATALELGMLMLGGAAYATYVFKQRKAGGSRPA